MYMISYNVEYSWIAVSYRHRALLSKQDAWSAQAPPVLVVSQNIAGHYSLVYYKIILYYVDIEPHVSKCSR